MTKPAKLTVWTGNRRLALNPVPAVAGFPFSEDGRVYIGKAVDVLASAFGKLKYPDGYLKCRLSRLAKPFLTALTSGLFPQVVAAAFHDKCFGDSIRWFCVASSNVAV